MPHTVVLVQFSGSRDSRKYFDYDHENTAFDGACAARAARALVHTVADVSHLPEPLLWRAQAW